MFEAMTTEMLLTGGNVVVGALSVAASLVMQRSPPKEGEEIDVDALVRDAPYLLLQNVISAQRAPVVPGMVDLP